MDNISIIIPARYESSRFPGKPLAKILGKEMIIRVCDICSKVLKKKNIYVATDDNRISTVVKKKDTILSKQKKNALLALIEFSMLQKKFNLI